MTTSRVEIYPNRQRVAMLTAGAFGFVAAGIVLIAAPDPFAEPLGTAVPTSVVRAVGVAGIAFFSPIFALLLRRCLAPTPVIVLDVDGVTDSSSALPAGKIGWDEIAEVVPYSVAGNRMLGLVPNQPDEILARLGWLKRFLLRLNLQTGRPLINVPQLLLPIPVEELGEMVDRRRAARAPR